MQKPMTVLPTTMMRSVTSTAMDRARAPSDRRASRPTRRRGLRRHPAGAASRVAARWLYSDFASTTPAQKAPSASDTPNSRAEPNAMPRAMARTASVNSSRDPARATWRKSGGSTRGPTSSMIATKAATFPRVRTTLVSRPPKVGRAVAASVAPVASTPASAGIRTRASTIAMSSTMSQPTAILPFALWTALRSSSARSSTTVLATERHRPNTRPAPKLQPHDSATNTPTAAASTI